MTSISHEERPIEGGIERTLFVADKAIAAIFFMQPLRDTMVVWPVAHTRADMVLNIFELIFSSKYFSSFTGANIEYWIGDHYVRSLISGPKFDAHSIIETLELHASELQEPVELLRLTWDGVWIELTFSATRLDVDRIAVGAEDFDVAALSEFFLQFHLNLPVRYNDEAKFAGAFRKVLSKPYVVGT